MIKTCKDFTVGIYKALNNVVKMLNRPDIKTVEALCIRLTGDVNAGRMLFRLLYWFPKSVKQTGEVYKSWRDWDAELCLTRDQVSRVHRERYLEAVGIQRRQRQTAKGNPIHYLLDVEKFLMVLAEFAGVSVVVLNVWLDSKPSTENTDDEFGESQQATTSTPTKQNFSNKNIENNNNDEVVVDANLVKIPGMKTITLIALIRQYGLERVNAMFEYGQRQQAGNISGFVRQGLKENWEIKDVPPQKLEKSPFAELSWSDFASENDWLATKRKHDPTEYISGPFADFIES